MKINGRSRNGVNGLEMRFLRKIKSKSRLYKIRNQTYTEVMVMEETKMVKKVYETKDTTEKSEDSRKWGTRK